MKRASIDIGTNSVLLLVAEKSKGELNVLHEIQELPRLGEGVDRDKKLGEESQERVINVLKSYRAYLSVHYPQLVSGTIVTATSAVRDASNRESFVTSVHKETGWEIRLLSGMEEAQITYRGALSVLKTEMDKSYIVLDIGGGSTEIAFGIGQELINGVSIDMGSVRFSERFFRDSNTDLSLVNEVRAEVRRHLKEVKPIKKPFTIVGVAGTVTSIAAVQSGLDYYDANFLNGYLLKKAEVDKYITHFVGLTPKEIEAKNVQFLKGRGDVILAGIIILSEFLVWCDTDSLLISTGGIRHGMIA